MTVISLATEHSDPVAPQRMGGGWGAVYFFLCNLPGLNQLCLIALKKSQELPKLHRQQLSALSLIAIITALHITASFFFLVKYSVEGKH